MSEEKNENLFDYEDEDFIFKEDAKEKTAIICAVRCWETFADNDEKDTFLVGLSVCAYCGQITDKEHFYILFENDEFEERKKAECKDNDEYYFAEFDKTGLVRAIGLDRNSADCVLDNWCHGAYLLYKDWTPRKKREI